ncbi:MAG: metal-sensitive transcriptional regulator [Cyanobacteria bacterium]|nr:metal-sensitive transcriptional regulator [Cyanobacteriota bacterium]
MALNSDNKKPILQRLARISGHVEAVATMVDEERYCIDVLHQIKAVQSALEKVSEAMLRQHLATCVVQAVNDKDEARAMSELLAVFRRAPNLLAESEDLEALLHLETESKSDQSKSGCCGGE